MCDREGRRRRRRRRSIQAYEAATICRPFLCQSTGEQLQLACLTYFPELMISAARICTIFEFHGSIQRSGFSYTERGRRGVARGTTAHDHHWWPATCTQNNILAAPPPPPWLGPLPSMYTYIHQSEDSEPVSLYRNICRAHFEPWCQLDAVWRSSCVKLLPVRTQLTTQLLQLRHAVARPYLEGGREGI